MHDTLWFSGWQQRFGSPAATALPTAIGQLRRCTLDQIEDRFSPWLAGVSACTVPATTARERPYSVRRTWWSFLWQVLQGNVACRAVVRQLQAMLALEGDRPIDEGTSAYCQARARLDLSVLQQTLRASAQAAVRRAAACDDLQGRVVKVLDGTTLALADTAANQTKFPQPPSQQRGCGFPQLNLLVVWHAGAGVLLDEAHADYHHGELRLLHQLGPRLAQRDIVIYDRAAGHYAGVVLLQARGVDLISRVHTRRIDWRRGQVLGPNERLVHWPRSRDQPAYLTHEQWAQMPASVPVRLLRVIVKQKGFRTRELALITTLLDPVAYPAAQIINAYLRRWRLEMCLDDLKTTLGLEHLRCLSPAMVERELLMLLTAHNLIRATMAQAATTHHVPLDRLSFTGTLHTLRHYCSACAHARCARQRLKLWTQMLAVIAADLVPLRPDRWEPRAVKHRPKSYPPLSRPRHLFRQRRHGSLYRRSHRQQT